MSRNANSGNTIYVDGRCGAAGDMLVAALIDLGVPTDDLDGVLEGLGLEGWSWSSFSEQRCGLAVQRVDVRLDPTAPLPHRDWHALQRIFEGARLDRWIRRRALEVFRRLLEAEAKVHGKPFAKTHLHEAGGIDAIIDVTAAVAADAWLGRPRWVGTELTTGTGQVRCAHGLYPLPAPATLQICADAGIPIRPGAIEAERLTPTGAALLATFVTEWGPMPPMRPWRVGYGAGAGQWGDAPNALRLIQGTTQAATTRGAVDVLECSIDDGDGQELAHVAARLRDAGALDVTTSPVGMKKGRPGTCLTVLCRPGQTERLAGLMLEHSSTLGLRIHRQERIELPRQQLTVETRFGSIRIKLGQLPSGRWKGWPEYEDCSAAATRCEAPLRDVRAAAMQAWLDRESPRRTAADAGWREEHGMGQDPASVGGRDEATPTSTQETAVDQNETPKPTPPADTPVAKPAAPAAEKAADGPKQIKIDQFFETDLRVAKVLAAEKVENADKLLKLQIDLGSEQRQLVAGVALSYPPEELVGKRIIVVANLKPARIRGVDSQGMLLAADLNGRPIVATFDEDVPPGTQVR